MDLTNEEKINNILDLCKSMPTQKSKEWVEFRRMKIGGSEIHNVINLKLTNITTFINNFLNNKIERKKIFIPQCEWGILFENEITRFTENYYNTIVYEVSIVQNDKISNVSYSPDGIGIIDNQVVLFEFKCPYSRIPTPEIKFDYKCQINTGLNTLPYCEKCYYIEAEFKKCNIEDLYNYNKFDTVLHNIKTDRGFTELYKTYGLLYIYEPVEKIDKEVIKMILFKNKIKNNIIVDNIINFTTNEKKYNTYYDIGKYNKYWFFSNFLNKLFTQEYKVVYFSDLIKQNEINKEFLDKYKDILPYNNNKKMPTREFIKELQTKFKNYIEKIEGRVIGFLPWKLYNYNVIIHEKNLNFFNDKLKNKLTYVGDLLNSINTLNTIEEKKEFILSKKSQLIKLIADNK